MCFGVSYDCTVYCINTHLNTTALASGIITGDGYGSGCSTPLPTPSLPFSPEAQLAILLFLGIVAFAVAFWLINTRANRP